MGQGRNEVMGKGRSFKEQCVPDADLVRRRKFLAALFLADLPKRLVQVGLDVRIHLQTPP
jgi:hypothetical protein